MNNLFAILTGTTCGDACWHAREQICRCSCGGANHGILTQGGTQPVRGGKIDGNAYELVAVIPGRQMDECWNDVFDRIDAERNKILDDRFPGIDRYAYGAWRQEKTMPVVDRKINSTQAKWSEVVVVPGAIRLIWSRPIGSPYYVRGADHKAVLNIDSAYESRVRALEAEGMSRSDAQGVADAEEIKRIAAGKPHNRGE